MQWDIGEDGLLDHCREDLQPGHSCALITQFLALFGVTFPLPVAAIRTTHRKVSGHQADYSPELFQEYSDKQHDTLLGLWRMTTVGEQGKGTEQS